MKSTPPIPTTQVLSLLRTAQDPAAGGAAHYAGHMLSELLARHEDMIVQLKLECLEAESASPFLTRMIEQHQRDSTMLRAQIDPLASPLPPFGKGDATGLAAT